MTYRFIDDNPETGMSRFKVIVTDAPPEPINPVAAFAAQSPNDYPGPAAINIRYDKNGEPVFDGLKVYTPPEIIAELDLETQAGSPGPCGTPSFPLPESELGKCK